MSPNGPHSFLLTTPAKKTRKATFTTTLVRVPSTSGLHMQPDNSSSSISTSDDDGVLRCAVCHRFRPKDIISTYTLDIVNWGQCDCCGHWTPSQLLHACEGVEKRQCVSLPSLLICVVALIRIICISDIDVIVVKLLFLFITSCYLLTLYFSLKIILFLHLI